MNDILYSEDWIDYKSYKDLVNFRVNGNETDIYSIKMPLSSFIHIDIEYKQDYLVTFRPGNKKYIRRSYMYDVHLYNYIVDELHKMTGWSVNIIKSYFRYG